MKGIIPKGRREELFEAWHGSSPDVCRESAAAWEAWCASWSARAGEEETETTVNRMPVTNAKCVSVASWSVAEWFDNPDAQGHPDAVALLLELPLVQKILSLVAEAEGEEPPDAQTLVRLKSASIVDDIVEALLTRRNGVWPHEPARFRKA